MKALSPDWLNIDLPFPCEIHSPRFRSIFSPLGFFRVYVDSWEPRSSCESIKTIFEYARYFDLILTQDTRLLSLSNAKLFVGGGSWVYPWMPQEKEYSLSFLCTSNNYLPGYRIRHELWACQHQLTAIPLRFWSSRDRPIDTTRLLPIASGAPNDKCNLFYSQFSFCPENTRQNNYFTEKIIDCFVTKTIPVYWGCPNIGDYFDARGIIVVDDISDLISKINRLCRRSYQQLMPYVEENYRRSLYYANPDLSERLRLEIMKAYACRTIDR